MTNALTKLCGSGVLGIKVQGVVIAGDDGKKFDIPCCD
jgi:hypothetical protein